MSAKNQWSIKYAKKIIPGILVYVLVSVTENVELMNI